jgi:hypothetical protein
MLQQLIGPVTGLLDKFIEDKDKKNAIAFELSTMAEKHAQELAKAQIEVNKTEAAHRQKRHTEAYLCRVGDLLLVGLVVLDLRVTTFLSRWQILRLLLPILPLKSLF